MSEIELIAMQKYFEANKRSMKTLSLLTTWLSLDNLMSDMEKRNALGVSPQHYCVFKRRFNL